MEVLRQPERKRATSLMRRAVRRPGTDKVPNGREDMKIARSVMIIGNENDQVS